MHLPIYRSATNRVFSGVLGGLAEYFDWNATVLRWVWVLGSFINVLIGLMAYLILLLLMKDPTQ